MGQALAAEPRRAGQRCPAAFGELLIGSLETVGGAHAAGLRVVLATLFVTGPIEGGEYVLGQLGRFFENCAAEVGS